MSALLLVSASAVANPYRGYGAEVVAERGCTLEGENVSGVVSVQMSEATREQIAIVGVRASIRLAPIADDVTVFVTAPLRFEGRFVSRGLGGPSAHVVPTFRSRTFGMSLRDHVPFEVTLSEDGERVTGLIASEYGDGHVAIELPCAGLVAGAPVAPMPPAVMRTHPPLIALTHDTRVRQTATDTGPELARVVSSNGASPVTLVGRGVLHGGSYHRVSIEVGGARIEGYVPRASLTLVGRRARPAPVRVSVEALPSSDVPRKRSLPVGTPIFGDANTARPWATLTQSFDVRVRSEREGVRSAVVLGASDIGVSPCRYDGVMGRPECADAASSGPRIGSARCTDARCVDIAFIDGP